MQGPLAPGYINKDQQGKCYDYNFRGGGRCQKKPMPYKHLCMRCSRNHPSIRCFSLNLPANRSNSRPITAPTAWRPIPSTPLSQPPNLDISRGATTPVEISKLKNYLQGYSDQHGTAQILQGFSERFKICYSGPRHATNCRNLKSLVGLEEQASHLINKEIFLGRVAGPFPRPPFPNLR